MNPNSTRHQVPRFLRFNWPTQPPASSGSITTIPITVRFRFDILPPQTAALSRSPCRSLFPQSGVEQMREPDTGFLHLLPDDRGVHRDMGRVVLHVARWMIAGRALSNAVPRSRLFRDGEGLVCPVHRLRTRPALNLGWRDRFQQLGSRFAHV